ncbi:MAG: arsenate reductase ArsC [bacterium]
MKILFMCTANSCRSQIAETWARHLLPGHWEIHSGGLLTYRITSRTRNTMAEVGLDMNGQESKTIDVYDLDDFDLIVTLSSEAGRFLPALTRPERHVHRPLDDPMSAEGSDEEIVEAFRVARDSIRGLIERIAASQIIAEESDAH